jgi:hypothetical protein
MGPSSITRSCEWEAHRFGLPIGCRLLAFDEGENIDRFYLRQRLLNKVQKDLEIAAIVYPGIETTTISWELEISVCLGHSQRYVYNNSI